MDFDKVVSRRRMVREFAADAVPAEVLERVLDKAFRGPSAGFAQGLELVVLDDPEALDNFWNLVDPESRKHKGLGGDPPVIVIPYSGKPHYLHRYSQPDKRGFGMGVEEGWPVPYWDLDAAMGVMLMLLAATDAGLGGWYFGIFQGEERLAEWLGVPEGFRAIGAVALGYPSESERLRGSAISRRRRPTDHLIHRGGW